MTALQLRIMAKKDPAGAVVQFMLSMRDEMEEEKKQMRAEITREVLSDVADIVERVKTEHDAKALHSAMSLTLANIKGEKGEPGATGPKPVKGVDYFTQAELMQIVRYVQSLIRVPKDGFTPLAGVDYPTEEQVLRLIKDEVAKEPKYNEQDLLEKVLPQVKALFPKVEFDYGKIVRGINALPVKPEFLFKMERIDGLRDALRALRSRKLGGGGGGGGWTELTATGTINGSNTSFTFSAAPDFIVSDGVWHKSGGGFSLSGLTATMSVAPAFSIFGVVK